ncbi:OmpA family protein [Vibrio diabolicus]|uniref:MotY family protein n=1 Tax=Vibrio diabolicus subgroup TaxID=2315253 RepID=UPI0009410040|nr:MULTISPECIES: OmpA family protein [Vibrio diabolicus subgroup]MCR9611390.1 OmpA family protein [Vibrio alginolyticus]MCE3220209.1 OmpA family protein [Vibrio diabolicus]MCS0306986.1 OmpA family protein [Vibrio diabolicus]MDV5033706.1 OmpA family protein [Vibrio diabolicus]OKQ16479.1 flagellar protein MotY [Vibrio antiquarius]
MISYASYHGLVAYLIKLIRSWNCKIYMDSIRLIICNTLIFVSFIFSKLTYSGEVLTIPMDLSKWIYKGNLFECNLLQSNRLYGKFYFRSEPNNKTYFISDIHYENNKWKTIALISQSAPWSSELYRKEFATLDFTKPSQRFVFSKGADELMDLIATGNWVTLSLKGSDASSLSEIVIPTIQIQNALKSFNACRARLPKLSFSEARNLVLSFDFGQKALSRKQQETLAALNSYVSVDDRVTKILIDGHTDNVGSSLANLSVSRTRAEQVAEALVELGIDKSMIETRAHGSRYPIASNNSTKGQAKNRRVTLRLVRDNERTAVKHHPDVQQQNQQTKVKVQ